MAAPPQSISGGFFDTVMKRHGRAIAVKDAQPNIAVETIGSMKGSRPGDWRFEWRVRNRTDQPIDILAARCPHGKFKSDERRFDPVLRVPPAEEAVVVITVVCEEPVGAVVENAFLLLLADWRDARWRIFVRLKVIIEADGSPVPSTELITFQRAGFSEALA